MERSVREQTEQIEKETLSPHALLAAESKGRDVHEDDDAIRTCFQRDRDRIVHSKAFRRLAHKTQVFLAPEGDHYRVRLTHTLEVTQVARTIARALRLNEDLVEAVCLGHDLGHTPFGHLGEEMVAEFTPGFRHNLQSVRIVEVLESLNLTWEVRDGIANHTWSMPTFPATLEGQIARYADRIAYINHDIDDAVRAGILTERDLPPHALDVLGRTHAKRIQTMVGDLVEHSSAGSIEMSDAVFEAMGQMRKFMFERVYVGRVGDATRSAVRQILTTLLDHYSTHPVPDKDEPSDTSMQVAAVDYVAGMTDRFALRAYEWVTGSPPPDLGVGALG
jgi:dGTPase